MSSPSPKEDRDQLVLVHLSDLHVGTRLMPTSRDIGRVSGLNPHDYRLLRPLELAFRDVRRTFQLTADEPLNIVISGDLTQAGLDNDYATVMALLYRRWQWRFPPNERTLGFGWSRDRVFTVPGNHDHWRRARSTAYTRGLAPDWFEVPPWKHTLESRHGSIRLELFGVDSNSGLESASNPGRGSFLAGGAISHEELQVLEERLAAVDGESDATIAVVRALVCHHAFSREGLLDPWPLDVGSRQTITQLAVRYDIGAVLTGHTHAFDDKDWPATLPDGRRGVLKELRCASTLQATRGSGFQGFWVHKITRVAAHAGCLWTACRYQKAGTSFDLNNVEPVEFTVPLVQLA
jgi:Calcineurin-like phosphoesterase